MRHQPARDTRSPPFGTDYRMPSQSEPMAARQAPKELYQTTTSSTFVEVKAENFNTIVPRVNKKNELSEAWNVPKSNSPLAARQLFSNKEEAEMTESERRRSEVEKKQKQYDAKREVNIKREQDVKKLEDSRFQHEQDQWKRRAAQGKTGVNSVPYDPISGEVTKPIEARQMASKEQQEDMKRKQKGLETYNRYNTVNPLTGKEVSDYYTSKKDKQRASKNNPLPDVSPHLAPSAGSQESLP